MTVNVNSNANWKIKFRFTKDFYKTLDNTSF